MKKLGLVLSICLMLQSLAMAAPKESLKRVIDDYRYALIVEWDQKDQAQLEKIKLQFTSELKAVIEQGLSVKELKEVLKASQVDEAMIATIASNGKVDLEKAQALIDEKSEHLYAKGSSWAPDVGSIALYGFLGLLVFEIVVLIITTPDDVCPNGDSHDLEVPYSCNYAN